VQDLDPVAAVLLTIIFALGISQVVMLLMFLSGRDERDYLKSELVRVVQDRDGWRDVANRALLVAQVGRNTTRRAANLANRVGKS
jgi:hypothetical protein